MNRKELLQLGILTAATLLGIFLAAVLGQILTVRAGKYYLNAYAARLEQAGIRIDEQSENAFATLATDHLPVCSPEEIVLFRGLLFRSSQIKDIGRTKDKKFLCSAGVGALPQPVGMPVPDHDLSGRLTYASTPVMVGSRARGFILQSGDITVVLSPGGFDGLEEPDRTFAAFVFDPKSRILVQDYGKKLPLSNEEILAGGFLQRSGVYYLPICSAEHRVCVVAAQARGSFERGFLVFHRVLLVTGGLLGNCLALIALLLLRKHRSQEQQLRRALRRGDVHLVFQPILDLQTRRTVGAEALARWVNEDGETVSPDVFVQLAEQKGFVNRLTRYVVRAVLAQLGDLLALGEFYVTINIASEDLVDPTFLGFLQDSLEHAKVSASAIGLELTERSSVTREVAIAAIARLREAGFKVYIDDFGTGYSSLAYLRDLSVDCIKIDRAFTATLGTHAVTEVILPQVLSLAVTLNLRIVAEGIETAEQADYFAATGRGVMGQGWFFSEPLPPTRLRRYLQESNAVVPTS